MTLRPTESPRRLWKHYSRNIPLSSLKKLERVYSRQNDLPKTGLVGRRPRIRLSKTNFGGNEGIVTEEKGGISSDTNFMVDGLKRKKD